MPCRDQSGFIDQIRKIGTRESRRSASDHVDIDVLIERDFPRMDLQDSFTSANVRVRNYDLTIKTSGPQKRRIENVGSVGRRHQDDAVIRFETVHLDQKLVQRLLAFIVTTAQAGTAVSTHRVYLIDEDNAR